MKTFILFLLFVCNLMAFTAEDAAWLLGAQTDLNKAFAKAKTEKKQMIVLLIVKNGCNWCEMMVDGTMRDPKIKEALKDAVTVVIDKKSELAKKYKAKMTPTVHFIDVQSKKSVAQQIGYEKPGMFLITIHSAWDKIGEE